MKHPIIAVVACFSAKAHVQNAEKKAEGVTVAESEPQLAKIAPLGEKVPAPVSSTPESATKSESKKSEESTTVTSDSAALLRGNNDEHMKAKESVLSAVSVDAAAEIQAAASAKRTLLRAEAKMGKKNCCKGYVSYKTSSETTVRTDSSDCHPFGASDEEGKEKEIPEPEKSTHFHGDGCWVSGRTGKGMLNETNSEDCECSYCTNPKENKTCIEVGCLPLVEKMPDGTENKAEKCISEFRCKELRQLYPRAYKYCGEGDRVERKCLKAKNSKVAKGEELKESPDCNPPPGEEKKKSEENPEKPPPTGESPQ